MVVRILLLVSCIICYLRLHYINPQQPDIHTSFKTWCPHSSSCDQEHNIPVRQPQEEYSDKHLVPCCSTCSCDKECGLARNCCKYEYDLYRLDETLDTICKQLQIQHGVGNAGIPFYHIIDKCPNRSEICRSIDDESYDPVYAKGSKMLYYNAKCASCHSQVDLVTFTYLVACENQFVSPFSSLRHKNRDIVSPGCALNWIPADDLDLSTEICYPHIINKCSPRYNSSHMFDVLCGMINATFRTDDKRVFSNVFCFLCSRNEYDNPGDFSKAFEFCPTDKNDRGTAKKPLVILLETTQISSPTNGDSGRIDNTPVWCKSVSGKVNCRPVFCPEGQMYVGGKCQMFGKQWYFNMLRINVKLTIPMDYKIILQKDSFFSTGSFDEMFYLRRPGLQDSLLTLSYNLDTDNNTIRFFIALLYYEKKTIGPDVLINKIKRSFQTRWKLYWNQQEYFLVPNWNPYFRYATLFSGINLPNTLTTKQNTTMEEIRFLAGHKKVHEIEDERESFFLSKLFICPLIELDDAEYEYNIGRLAINNGSKDLEEGEFTWAHITDVEHKPLICLYDLPGYSNSSNGKQTNMYLWLIGAWIFVLFNVS